MVLNFRFFQFIVSAIVCLQSVSVYSQKVAVTYYNDRWYLTTRELAAFYRVGILDTATYKYSGEVKDYYIDGKLQMRGTYQANIQVDTFYFYFPNGRLMSKGLYKDDFRYGIWTYYHQNGKVKDKVAFDNHFICALESYDEDGQARLVNGKGVWQAEFCNDVTGDSLNVIGSYVDTLRDGSWQFYNKSMFDDDASKKMKLICTEEYARGNFVKGEFYWRRGRVEHIATPVIEILPETDKFRLMRRWEASKYASINVYPFLKFLPPLDSSKLPVDKLAKFPGGFDALVNVLARNMDSSLAYLSSGSLHSVTVEVEISSKGTLKVISIHQRPSDTTFANWLSKNLKQLPAWKPAVRNGKNANCYFKFLVSISSAGGLSIMVADHS